MQVHLRPLHLRRTFHISVAIAGDIASVTIDRIYNGKAQRTSSQPYAHRRVQNKTLVKLQYGYDVLSQTFFCFA